MVSTLALAALGVLKRIFLKIATEKFLMWGFFFFGEMIVESTKTKKDDKFLAKLKAACEEDEKNESTLTD